MSATMVTTLLLILAVPILAVVVSLLVDKILARHGLKDAASHVASKEPAYSLSDGAFRLYVLSSFTNAFFRFLLAYGLIAAVPLSGVWTDGFAASGDTFLLVGCGISVLVFLLYYVLVVFLSFRVRTRLWMVPVMFLMPSMFGFSAYIISARALWPLLHLFTSFSLMSMLTGLLYLLLGIYSFIPLTKLSRLATVAAKRRSQTPNRGSVSGNIQLN